ncbi:penicillin-binding transpeptidase domain-containing protein [Elioraea rosea]|uniref:penicillin-binding transpeptidase domain-containing protein n=1 Tax=Elioraea rosea TaxID=2492390 RepID=UPI001315A812|nr:penicillin-binding transpeptidase domain-containing protein [Elioraea rosea]
MLAGVAAAIAPATVARAQRLPVRVIDRTRLEPEFAGRDVHFIACDLASGEEIVLSGSDTDSRHTPWSTFKIPNLLIALETAIARDLDSHRRWDRVRYPAASYWPDDWRRDQTLRTAFERSAVWYFRDLAREVGTARYRDILARWRYGNAVVPDGSDDFWLNRTLMVSPREQAEFLSALLSGNLGVSRSSLDALAAASGSGRAEGASLHGKTGAGPVVAGRFDGAFEGWYSGFVLRDGAAPVTFSLFTTAPTFAALRSFRREASIRLLREAGSLRGAVDA